MIQLTKAVVQTSKNGKSRKASSREGYTSASGLVYLPPLSEKRKSSWVKKMIEKGYVFS